MSRNYRGHSYKRKDDYVSHSAKLKERNRRRKLHTDKDIDVDNVSCVVGKGLKQFDSLVDGDTYYFMLPDNIGWFSIIGGTPIYANTKDIEWYKKLKTAFIFCETLRSIYIMPRFRQNGYQKEIVKTVKKWCDACRCCMMAFCAPYHLHGEDKFRSVADALKVFHEDLQQPLNYETALEKQTARFRSYNFKNIDWSLHAGETDIRQQYIYVPFTVPQDERQVVESLLV